MNKVSTGDRFVLRGHDVLTFSGEAISEVFRVKKPRDAGSIPY